MLTMKMISSARIKRAQNSMISARPFARGLEGLIDDLRKEILGGGNNFEDKNIARFFTSPTAEKKNTGLILVTADKGLCGAFNALLLRAALNFIRERKGRKIYIFVVGKKGRDFISRLKIPEVEIVYESVGIFPKVGYVHANILGDAVAEKFLSLGLDEVNLIYNDFKSMGAQHLVNNRILPFDFEFSKGHFEEGKEEENFLYEPGKETILLNLIFRHVKASLYRILLESQAAELAARMNAMDAAGKNAREISDALKLKLNKVRQATITNEITEIVGAVEALNG